MVTGTRTVRELPDSAVHRQLRFAFILRADGLFETPDLCVEPMGRVNGWSLVVPYPEVGSMHHVQDWVRDRRCL